MKARRTEPLKLKHKDLEQMGMIASVDADIDKSDLKSISYIFTPFDGGRCKVEVFYTKLISISVPFLLLFSPVIDFFGLTFHGFAGIKRTHLFTTRRFAENAAERRDEVADGARLAECQPADSLFEH
jgi:hypothetical protein